MYYCLLSPFIWFEASNKCKSSCNFSILVINKKRCKRELNSIPIWSLNNEIITMRRYNWSANEQPSVFEKKTSSLWNEANSIVLENQRVSQSIQSLLELCFLCQRIWRKHWEGQNSILYKAANFISLRFSSSDRLALKYVPELQLGKGRLNGNYLFGLQCHSLHQLKVLFCKSYSSGSRTDSQGPPQYSSKPPVQSNCLSFPTVHEA